MYRQKNLKREIKKLELLLKQKELLALLAKSIIKEEIYYLNLELIKEQEKNNG